jgi:hypothetical protein
VPNEFHPAPCHQKANWLAEMLQIGSRTRRLDYNDPGTHPGHSEWNNPAQTVAYRLFMAMGKAAWHEHSFL